MKNNTIIELKRPAQEALDPLTELLRQGARDLIARAVEDLSIRHRMRPISLGSNPKFMPCTQSQ